MAKVATRSKPKPKKPGAVTEKRVRNIEGQVKTVWTLDARSPTFGTDLQYVFRKNVAKARRENRRIIGAADVAVSKR
jgi:hypothetical protein